MNCHDCHQNHQPKQQKKNVNLWNLRSKKEPKKSFSAKTTKTIALVGFPNVGKSLLFNLLTDTYVNVSNYPGTTVEITRGDRLIAGEKVTFIDTPGMYSLMPITEEESVARNLITDEILDLVIHVVDAKHLGRMLNLTLQLMETKIPMLLVVNAIDEAQKSGICINEDRLAYRLGIPVVKMSATQKRGLKKLIAKVADYVQSSSLSLTC